MLGKIAVGLGLVVLTTMVQAAFMLIGIRFMDWRKTRFGHIRHEGLKALMISGFTAWMFMAIVLEALIWALFYLYEPEITALPDLETALYFSMVTFTTVGYGDVVLTGNWRMLASIQAANGVIVFGWTTALIFYVIQQVYRRD
jgi:hypothetical protein